MVGEDTSILVVEGDTDFRRVVSLLLTSAGYSVAEAADWAQAAIELRTRHYAVILADFRIPHKDGEDPRDICRNLCPSTPVIVFANSPEPPIPPDPRAGTPDWAFACCWP